MPRHVNPGSNDPAATAPYNFVPLPERIFDVAEGIDVGGGKVEPWKSHDRFVPGTFSGRVELAIETLTPLFIRGAARQREGGSWDGRESRLRPEPYTTRDERPAIPGSSIRGMVRSLVEILAFAKIQPVSQTRPFFRDLSPNRISTEYRSHFIEDLEEITEGIDVGSGQKVTQKARGYRARVRAGFLSLRDRTIRECGFARIEQKLIKSTFNGSLLDGSGPMATPNWSLQYAKIWVRADPEEQNYFFRRKTNKKDKQIHPNLYLRFRKVESALRSAALEHQSGRLVITGGISNKHLEFVFLDSADDATRTIRIPDDVWSRFHDDDQITQWQEKAFPADRPTNRCRKSKGHLRDAEPVFFLTDDKGDIRFLGRAQMFRFPYDLSPEDLVPDSIRRGPLDLAEAMFGYVRQVGETPAKGLKGRVFFEDAVATSPPPTGGWFEDILVPKILSAPKPTTFQHYLTQDGTKGKDQLTTYLKGDHTAIRGHKLYWHRWSSGQSVETVKETAEHAEKLRDLVAGRGDGHTQHTIIRPVKERVTFVGHIRFENLTELELGALLHAVRLPDGCAHRLGMGKPLGLGSLRIRARLNVTDRTARYSKWQASGARDEDVTRFREAFDREILNHARGSQETLLEKQDGLRRIARLDALFRILEWENRPEPHETAYITDLGRFRDRPVLPTPHGVAGASEPPWPVDPPEPAGGGGSSVTSGDGQQRRPQVDSVPMGPKPVQRGQTLPGRLKRGADGWVAVFDEDAREAQIINPAKIDAGCSEGTEAEFYIIEQSKRVGIRCRLEKVLQHKRAAKPK